MIVPEVSPLAADTLSRGGLQLYPVNSDNMEPTLRLGDYVLAAPVSRFVGDTLYVVDWGEDGRTVPCVIQAQMWRTGTYLLVRHSHRYGRTMRQRSDEVPKEWFNSHVLGVVVCDLRVRDREALRRAWEGARHG